MPWILEYDEVAAWLLINRISGAGYKFHEIRTLPLTVRQMVLLTPELQKDKE